MSKYLRQSTASQEFVIGTLVDSTDGNTQETGLTIANTDIKVWKTGATTLASKNSGGGTHIANGRYSGVWDATDTDTLGAFKAYVHVSGALAWEDSWTVLPAQVYDSLVLGTDLLDISVVQNNGSAITQAGGRQEVNVSHFGGSAGTFASGRAEVNTTHAAGTAWGSGAITAASIASNAITSAKIATDAIGASQIAANAITSAKIATGAITSATFAAGAINAAAIATDAITSAKIATDAIGSAQIAASAVTEIQTGLESTVVHSGTAQSGSSTNIRLAAGASAVNNVYRKAVVFIRSGTGAGQSNQISAYNGTTKDATTIDPWDVVPDATSVYALCAGLGVEASTDADIVDAIYDQPVASNQLAGSRGEMQPVNVVALSGDTAAADALEAMCDGTGTPIPADVRYIKGQLIGGDGITTLFFVNP